MSVVLIVSIIAAVLGIAAVVLSVLSYSKIGKATTRFDDIVA